MTHIQFDIERRRFEVAGTSCARIMRAPVHSSERLQHFQRLEH
jgi:hypothetical protein